MRVSRESFIWKTIGGDDFQKTLINHSWRLFSGPVMLLLIPLYLSPEEQGFWFTFASLAALVVLADLGFSTILLQFSAHEFSNLSFTKKNTLEGTQKDLNRISSLFRFSIRWSILASIVVLPIIFFIGLFVFSDKKTDVEWLIPWLIYSVASLFGFVNSIILSFIEGCNRVAHVNKVRFLVGFFNFFVIVTLLIGQFSLFTLAIASVIGVLITLFLIYKSYKNLIKQLWLTRETEHNWTQDMFPLLGRYSISWLSGYFIFQLFTPLAFHFYGPVKAGQVGLTLSILTAFFTISYVWMTIFIPKINMLVAQGNYKDLNLVFWKSSHLAATTMFLISCSFLLVLPILNQYINLSERLVSSTEVFLLAGAWVIQVYINSMAIYMRAHKREPLMWLSLFNALYIAGVTVIAVHYLSADFIFIGFVSSFLWVFPLVIYIFMPYSKGVIRLNDAK